MIDLSTFSNCCSYSHILEMRARQSDLDHDLGDNFIERKISHNERAPLYKTNPQTETSAQLFSVSVR